MNAATTTPSYGYSDEPLLALPTAFRECLFKGQVVLVSGAGSGLGTEVLVHPSPRWHTPVPRTPA